MIEETMEAYSRWTRAKVLPDKPKNPLAKFMGSDEIRITLSDDDGNRIDQAMIRLRFKHPTAYAVVNDSFVKSRPMKETCAHLGITKTKYYEMKNNGLAFIDGKLDKN